MQEPIDQATLVSDQSASWWRQAAVYQIYPRSFADSNGDGIGDLRGIASRLDYLSGLGIDAVWLSPFYPSDLADGGYDVIDYRDIDPRIGTLADFDELVAGMHARGIRILIDIVPNHTSDEHAWFRQAVAAGPGSPLGTAVRMAIGVVEGHHLRIENTALVERLEVVLREGTEQEPRRGEGGRNGERHRLPLWIATRC